jgi:hypothetical protein
MDRTKRIILECFTEWKAAENDWRTLDDIVFWYGKATKEAFITEYRSGIKILVNELVTDGFLLIDISEKTGEREVYNITDKGRNFV